MSERIQRRRTKGWRMPEGAVYVGRPTYWGNPYVILGPEVFVDTRTNCDYMILDARKGVVDEYRKYVRNTVGTSGFSMAYEAECELRGKDLACWCPLDAPCHADVLLEYANAAAAAGEEGT